MKLYLLIILAGCFPFSSIAQDATEIIRKADNKFQGEKSSISTMTMIVKRPKWDRTIVFKTWTRGRDYALTLILEPAKEKGQSFLKVKNEMWNWNPTISRMIKLPPSMLSQGWMGSDYTNDDLLRESSLVNDYTHKIIGSETIGGTDCWKIELLPKENAAVVWGKIIKWISRDDFDQLRTEYYDEDGVLMRTEIASDIKSMDNRLIPTRFEIIPADKPDNRTIVILNEIRFNVPIQESFFTQQNMKQVK
ncbi:MAG TPA: outer membrane lipoprotein-sorting protein [Bacteroidales bacterium]|nr:outer membrane lipoprotein-sorting protein [Bacteroidales bacterium]